MSEILNIQSIGYIANKNPNRAIRSGEEFEEIIPAPDWREMVVKRDADVSQTVAEMVKLIRESTWQTKALSQRLLGRDIYWADGDKMFNNAWIDRETLVYS